MTRSAVHKRLAYWFGVPGYTRIRLRLVRAGRAAALSGTSGLLIAGGLSLPAPAQTVAAAVRAEFRTTARPLITQTIDRSRLVPTRGAVHREVATAQDLGPRDPSATMDHIQLVLQ